MIVSINKLDKDNVNSILDEINRVRDDISAVVVTYVTKDNRINSMWAGALNTTLIGYLHCTMDDLLQSMRE